MLVVDILLCFRFASFSLPKKKNEELFCMQTRCASTTSGMAIPSFRKNIIEVMRYRNSFRKDDGFEYSIPIEKGADVVPGFIYKRLLEYAKEQASARPQ